MAVILSIHGHTIARNRKEKTAPSARPRDRKKAMMAPAVSASASFTFLEKGARLPSEGDLGLGRGDLPEHLIPPTNPPHPPNPSLAFHPGGTRTRGCPPPHPTAPFPHLHRSKPRRRPTSPQPTTTPSAWLLLPSSLSLKNLSSRIKESPFDLSLSIKCTHWSSRPCLMPPRSPLTWARNTCRYWRGSH